MADRQGNLRDAHVHLAAHGEELAAVDLSRCGSVGECLERVAARARETEKEGWIVARGARVEAWRERRYPTAHELDEAGGGRAVLVACFDHHGGAGSSPALAAARIGPGVGDAPGGVVERDASGAPTGVVLEGAFKAVCRAMPTPTEEEIKGHVRTAQQDLLGLGIVEVNDMMTTGEEARLLAEMNRAGELELRVVCYAVLQEFEAVRAALREHEEKTGRGGGGGRRARVRFGGMKLFTDGTLNSRTAHMLRPYAVPIPGHPCGTPLMERAEIDSVFRRAREERFDVAAHAIGDAAVRGLLDAYETAGGGRDAAGFGLRIEHAQFVDEADVERFAAMGVVASVQPCHLLTDVEAILRHVPERAGRAFPLRDLVEAARAAGREARELVWFGSDTPVVKPTPRDNVRAAVWRRREDPSCPTIAPEQAIDEREAWTLMRAD